MGRLLLARGSEPGSTTSGDADRRACTACSPTLTATVPAAACGRERGRSLGTGFQPRGAGHGSGGSDAGDPREGAPPDAALRQRCRLRESSHHCRRECLEVRRLFRLPYRGLSVTPPTVGLKAGRTLEVAGHPAVMSLVTPTPACSGEIDRERRPRCSIVDRDPCRSPSLSSSSRSGVPPAAVHHDGLMAAGRILADGIGTSPGARERARRFGPTSGSGSGPIR